MTLLQWSYWKGHDRSALFIAHKTGIKGGQDLAQLEDSFSSLPAFSTFSSHATDLLDFSHIQDSFILLDYLFSTGTMRVTESIIAFLSLGALAMAFPVTDSADNEVFLDDQLAAEHSTNETIDAIEASGRGNAHVHNACDHPVVLQRCEQISARCGPVKHLAAGATHAEIYDPTAGNGIALKIRRQDGNFQNNILQFEYVNRGPGVHPRIDYDASEVNSDANDFWRKPGGGGFTVTTSDNNCFHKHCAPPCQTCPGVFTDPANGTPHNCGYGKNIGMTVCG